MRRLLLAIPLLAGFAAAQTKINPVTDIQGGLNAPDYIGVSRKPLFNWLRSLNNASNQALNIKLIGDSYMICDATICSTGPNTSTNRWPEQLRVNLQNVYGYGGTGIMPLKYSIQTSGLNTENYPATTGTIDTNLIALGPNGGSATTNSLVHMSSGATVTFQPGANLSTAPLDQFPYVTLYVYCMTNSSSGSLSVAIDGGSSVPLTACNSTSSTPTAHLASVNAGTLKVHSAVVTSTGDSYIYAMRGRAGSFGIEVSNLGFGGSDTTYWGANTTNELAFSNLPIGGVPDALTIIGLQTNDILHGIAPATMGANLQNIVTNELGLQGGPQFSPSVVLEVPPVSGGSGSYSAALYTAQQAAVYSANAIDMLNIQWRWGTTFSAASGLWSGDNIHPDDAGALDTAQQVMAKVAPDVPYTGSALQGANCIGGPNVQYQCAIYGFEYGAGGGVNNKAIIALSNTNGLTVDGASNAHAAGTISGSNLLAPTTLTSFTGTPSGVTVACVSSTCNSSSGVVSVISSTFTTGAIATLVWPATSGVPIACRLTQDGGTTWFGFGTTANPTSTGFSFSNANSIAGTTSFVAYQCQ